MRESQDNLETRRFPQEQRPARESIYYADMDKKPKYVARIDNIYFVNRVGASLRAATDHVITDDLPENIRLLLRRLERLEVRAKLRKTD